MKTKSIILSLLMVFSCVGLFAQDKKQDKKQTVVFNVPMDCQKCVNKIEKNIAFEKGVKNLDVNLEKQTASVTYDSRKTDVSQLQAAFQKIGYKATCCEANKENCTKAKEGCPNASANAGCCAGKANQTN